MPFGESNSNLGWLPGTRALPHKERKGVVGVIQLGRIAARGTRVFLLTWCCAGSSPVD